MTRGNSFFGLLKKITKHQRSKAVKENLFKQLDIIPTWEQAIQIGAKKIKKEIAPELQFEEIRNYLTSQNTLDISLEDIGEKWFQLLLFFVLYSEDGGFFEDMQIFDISAMNRLNVITQGWNISALHSLSLNEFISFSLIAY